MFTNKDVAEDKLQPVDTSTSIQVGHVHDNVDQLQRKLTNRQVQLLAIGGAIGTGLFVSIRSGLRAGGPGSLLIAFIIQCAVVAGVNNCIAEITVLHPVSGGFIRMAGKFADESLGFMAGWNFFLYEALSIPFEITAINVVLSYWRDDIPVAAVCAVCIVAYSAINLTAVRYFGEAEFWLSGGKVILIFILFFFTFISMVGGNPKHDAYGFRYWRNPGAFAETHSTGSLGRFEGFLGSLWSAAFIVVGPEFLTIAAAEAKRPRIIIKAAFKTVYWRFGIFFLGSALAVGIVCAYNDPLFKAGGAGAAATPYGIAMKNLGITGLPHLVNALLITSIFSAGNTYCYTSSRVLYSMALEGRAPKIFATCNRSGVPWVAFLLVMIFPFLSFLSLNATSNQVLTWMVNLITAGGIINYIVMTATYISFYKACKAQGVDRSTHPYFGRFQPWCAYIGLGWMLFLVIFYGYSSFEPWDMQTFFTNYSMQILMPILYFGWKFIKKTKIVDPLESDLIWERPVVDAYEATFVDKPVGFWREMLQMVGIGRHKEERVGVDRSPPSEKI